LPADQEQAWVVEPGFGRALLADFLAARMPGRRTLEHRQCIAEGRVRVNGEVCPNNRALRLGDVIQVRVPSFAGRRRAAARADLPTVLFESPSTLVIDKPPLMPTVPDRSGAQRGLHGVLPALRPNDDLRIVHRLDRDTSGCLLLAKGLASARHFDAEFGARRVDKTYLALVHGAASQPQFSIDAWLGPDPQRPGKVIVGRAGRRGFRPARTEVATRSVFAGFALLELRPATGRGHQLRVHLRSVGLPIVGDRDYGGEPLLLSQLKPGYKLRPGVVERPLLDRMFLHAERLVFSDLDGERIAVESPLPGDLAVALRQLQNFAVRRR
jgi:RluA family pseudouridine synthase